MKVGTGLSGSTGLEIKWGWLAGGGGGSMGSQSDQWGHAYNITICHRALYSGHKVNTVCVTTIR